MHFARQWNVGHAKFFAAHKRVACQVGVQHVEQCAGGRVGLGYQLGLAFFFRRTYQLDKGIAPGRVQRGLLPVHPLFGGKTLGQVQRIQAIR